MFVQNYENLLKLARNDTEKQVVNILLSSLNDVLTFAQPSTIMSESIQFDNDVMQVSEDTYDLSSYDNIYLISLGKASQTMSSWMLDNFPLSFSRIILVSPDETQSRFTSIPICKCFRGGHPVLNEESILAAEEVLSLLKKTSEKDLCIFLISGGGSALFESPNFDISLEDYKKMQNELLACGAPIHEMNTIRKHFSKVKGGELVSISNTNIVSFIISDVIGSDPSFIASGPTVPDDTTWKDCKTIFQRYNLTSILPELFGNLIDQGVNGMISETPSDSSLFLECKNYVIGDNLKLLNYIEEKLGESHSVELLDYKVSGEARDVGSVFATKAIQKSSDKQKHAETFSFLIFGGETTVTLSSGSGFGGRNQELALSFVLSTNASTPVVLVCIGTDGIDGNSNAAGSIVGPFTIIDEETRIEANKYLLSNDANSFFKKFGGEIITGYTGTNMMDIGIICIIHSD